MFQLSLCAHTQKINISNNKHLYETILLNKKMMETSSFFSCFDSELNIHASFLPLSLAVHALNKLPYSKLDSKSVGIREGVIFLTYSSLIASSERGRSRLQQLVQWCGTEFDGLIIFDEVGTFTYLSKLFLLLGYIQIVLECYQCNKYSIG